VVEKVDGGDKQTADRGTRNLNYFVIRLSSGGVAMTIIVI